MHIRLAIIGILIALFAGGALFVRKEKPLYDFNVPAEQEAEQERNIVVYAPSAGETVGLPIVVAGEARTFESNVLARVRDADGAELALRFTTARSPDAGELGPFEIRFTSYPAPKGTKGSVEVFEESAKDGSEINKVIVPITFGAVETTTVKAFFPNRDRDPGMDDCRAVYSVARRVAKTQTPARAAIEELLAGPTPQEIQNGFLTSINYGVALQALTIERGVARADFSDALEAGVGGSCRVANIRAQIAETLKQFSSVQSVVISIHGRTEDILQP